MNTQFIALTYTNVKVAKPLTHELTTLQIQHYSLSVAAIRLIQISSTMNGSLCPKSLELISQGR